MEENTIEENNSNNFMDVLAKGLQPPFLKDSTDKGLTIRVITEHRYIDEAGNIIHKEEVLHTPDSEQ